MSFEVTAASPLWFVFMFAAVLVSIGSYWVYRKTNPELLLKQRLILTVLRGFTMFMITLFLFGVEIGFRKKQNRKYELNVLVDASESMTINDRLGNRKLVVEEVLNQVEKKGNYFSVVVGDSIFYTYQPLQIWKNLTKTAKYTSSFRMLNAVKKSEHKVDGILWITDGNFLEGNAIPWLDIPTWVFPIGDTLPIKNAYLSELEIPTKLVKGKTFRIKVPVTYTSDDLQKASLRVSLTDGTQREKLIQLPTQFSQQLFEIELTSKSEGWQNLKVELNTDFEENKLDNVQIYPVYFYPLQQPIWILYQSIHPDIGSIKQSFANDSGYTVNLYSIQESIPLLTGQKPSTPPIIILYGSPDDNTNEGKKLAQLLLEHHGGFVWIPAHSRLSTILLERFASSGIIPHNSNEVIATQVFPTPLSEFSIITNDIQWSKLPPVAAWKKRVTVNQNVIATYATNEPAMVLQLGTKRSLLINVWDFWRWRHDIIESGRSHEFDKMMKYLIETVGTTINKPLQIILPRQIMESVETTLEIVWYNENGQRVTEGDIVLQIGNEKIPLQANAKGKFEYQWKPHQSGEIFISATALKANQKIYSDTIQVIVSSYNQELIDTRSHPNRLAKTTITGGYILPLHHLPSFLDSINQLTKVDYFELKLILWNNIYSLIFILGLLTAEWWYRVRLGML